MKGCAVNAKSGSYFLTQYKMCDVVVPRKNSLEERKKVKKVTLTLDDGTRKNVELHVIKTTGPLAKHFASLKRKPESEPEREEVSMTDLDKRVSLEISLVAGSKPMNISRNQIPFSTEMLALNKFDPLGRTWLGAFSLEGGVFVCCDPDITITKNDDTRTRTTVLAKKGLWNAFYNSNSSLLTSEFLLAVTHQDYIHEKSNWKLLRSFAVSVDRRVGIFDSITYRDDKIAERFNKDTTVIVKRPKNRAFHLASYSREGDRWYEMCCRQTDTCSAPFAGTIPFGAVALAPTRKCFDLWITMDEDGKNVVGLKLVLISECK